MKIFFLIISIIISNILYTYELNINNSNINHNIFLKDLEIRRDQINMDIEYFKKCNISIDDQLLLKYAEGMKEAYSIAIYLYEHYENLKKND